MPEPLEYSSLPRVRPRPRWTGTIVLTAVLGGGLSLLLGGGFHSQGLFPDERAAVFAVVFASTVCILVGSVRIRHDRETSGNVARAACIVGLGLAAVLNGLAVWGCLTAYQLR